jgi:hypothetical protein
MNELQSKPDFLGILVAVLLAGILVFTGMTAVALFDPIVEQGLGGAGVTNFDALDVAGAVNFGANDLYSLGFASDGQQVVYGTASITGTGVAAHGLTTVTFCSASLGEDPTAGVGEAAHVSVAVATNVCTLKAWQDDFVTAATEADVAVQWIVVGAP